MTTLLLIRHAQTDATGVSISGWQPGHHLNATGEAQAQKLAERLSALPIRSIHTSPLERAVETAKPIAALHKLELHRRNELGELRVGQWEGLTIGDLDQRDDWRRFNIFRSGARPPGEN